MTVINVRLIPLIISANFLSILGIIKTKRNAFISSQILFLALFLSDLTYGAVQIPVQIYLSWKSHDPTCFEILVGNFFFIYPTWLSGTLLCVITVDRYIRVVHKRYHKRIVTNKLLSFTITLATFISFIWAPAGGFDIGKFENLYSIMSTYMGAVLATGVAFNVALLKSVKQKTKNSSVQQALNFRFNKDSNFNFSYSGVFLFAINKHFSYFFTWITLFCRPNIYQSISSRFIRNIYTTSSKCCTQFSNLL